MLKITREMFDHIQLKSVSLENGDIMSLCQLKAVDGGELILSAEKNIGESVKMQLLFNDGETCKFNAAAMWDENKNECRIRIPIGTVSSRVAAMILMLSDMENKFNRYGRRKEPRLKIGKENWEKFGLNSLTQQVFLPAIKQITQCVILDISVHGICVIMPYADRGLNKSDNLFIKITFDSPLQSVIMNLHKVNVRINNCGTKKFASVSCQILEPVHFLWKEKVINYLKINGEQ